MTLELLNLDPAPSNAVGVTTGAIGVTTGATGATGVLVVVSPPPTLVGTTDEV